MYGGHVARRTYVRAYEPASHAVSCDDHEKSDAHLVYRVMGLRPAALWAAGAPLKVVLRGQVSALPRCSLLFVQLRAVRGPRKAWCGRGRESAFMKKVKT